jgi:hypothetical protein
MHQWLLKYLSKNVSDRPRIAMSHALYATDASFYDRRR